MNQIDFLKIMNTLSIKQSFFLPSLWISSFSHGKHLHAYVWEADSPKIISLLLFKLNFQPNHIIDLMTPWIQADNWRETTEQPHRGITQGVTREN